MTGRDRVLGALKLCILKEATAKDGRGTWRPARSCITVLMENGATPEMARTCVEAAMRVGAAIAKTAAQGRVPEMFRELQWSPEDLAKLDRTTVKPLVFNVVRPMFDAAMVQRTMEQPGV